jgi:hypothetical protein
MATSSPDYYVPAELTSADYPNLIPAGQSVDTISVSALLAVYNWKSDTDRYRRCVRFIEYLFNRFRQAAREPLSARLAADQSGRTIPGWTRFAPTQELSTMRRAQRSTRVGAPAGDTGSTQQRGRAGAPVPRVPGVEQAAETIMTRGGGIG